MGRLVQMVLLVMGLWYAAAPAVAQSEEQVPSAERRPVEAPGAQAPPKTHVPETPAGTGPSTPSLQPQSGLEAITGALEEGKFQLQAEHLGVREGAAYAEGGLRAVSGNMTLTADGAVVEPDQVTVHLLGHVVIGSPQMQTTATSIEINIETNHWRSTRARTEIKPGFFEGGVESPLFVRARALEGTGAGELVEALGASGTTCDREHPHYDLRSPKITAIPGRKVIFRKPSLYVFGHRLVRFPFNLALSLESKQNKFIPEFGQSEVEGYFAKLAYLYVLNPENSGLLRLNVTQKRGTGLGFDHTLETAQQHGELAVLWEPNEGALSSRLDHRWQMSQEMSSELTSNLQRNSGYYGETETLSNNWTLRRATTEANSQLGFQQSVSQSGSSTSRSFTSAFSHQQRQGANTDWSVRSNYRSSGYTSSQAADEELQSSLEYGHRARAYDWRVVADKRYDLDGSSYTGDSTYRYLNRLPQFTFNTDSTRMPGIKPLGRIGTQATVELGRYEQRPDNVTISRAALKLDLGGSERRITGSSRLRTAARYYQAFYDDGSAQYLLGATSQLRQELGDHWNLQTSLNYFRPDGYAPLQLDYWARQEDMQFQAVRLSPDHSRIDLSGGYDFVGNQWRTLLGQFEYMTSRSSKLEMQTGYDLEAATWRPLNARWTFVHPREMSLALGAQYQIEDSQLRQITMDLDWLVTPRTRLELQTTYSGYTHALDEMDVRVTRDLHCWIGSVAYSRLTGEFQVNLGLKAFPSEKTNFGSTRGPRFESGAGASY